jgi:RHS repeat-associated protein
VEDFIWRDGLLLGSQRPLEMGGRRHLHLDHLGTPRLITSDNGQLVSYHDYYPFGDEKSSYWQEVAGGFDREEPMKFTGHERDYAGGMGAEDGHAVDYMHARYYSPTAGRFLSVDPVLGKLNQPQSWNRYAYVMNNPMNRTDPTGLADQCPPPYKCAAPPPPPKPAIPVVLPIQAALAGIKPPPNVPVMKSASTPSTPSSKLVTFAVTAGVSAVVVGGGSASVSLLKSTAIGTTHDGVAATGSVNTPGFGINVGPYVTVGAYKGDVADQRGSTKDINWGFGNITGTLSWTPSGSFAGGSVGWGPTPTRIGFTTSESGTSVVTSRDVQDKLGIEP